MPLSREEWREVIADVEDDLAMARENAVAAAQNFRPTPKPEVPIQATCFSAWFLTLRLQPEPPHLRPRASARGS
jgi:hypothetical protein